MNKIIVVLLILLITASCGDSCDDAIAEYKKAQVELDAKNQEASELSAQIEAMELSDEDQSVLTRTLLEDELSIVLIDIAMLEISMEDWKKKKYHCF